MSESKNLSPREAAERIGVHRRTLTNWRAKGYGPEFIVMPSGWVKYPEHIVEQWIADNLQLKQVA